MIDPGQAIPREPHPPTAIVTASYAPDFERCRLLCETIDARVTGFTRHYILVEHSDVALFRQLEGTHRLVIDERDLLPPWLRSFRDPTSRFRRRIWLSPRTMPLRGWHVQQLRRIAIALNAPEDAFVYCDSDVAFVRPFDCGYFWHDGAVRLFRREDALAGQTGSEQREWSAHAGRILGVAHPEVSPHDYIATLIAWRRDSTEAMCRRIEAITGRHWVAGIASRRMFSECMIYGRHAAEVAALRGHFLSGEELCRVYWTGPRMSEADMRDFLAALAPHQVAVGMQSFIGTDVATIRRLVA
ncbi:DUF6492 family protein [Aquibium microcysteis]|uniref:DUF6492 family protein n=1 Tax=Aquibium microcysteis TaxID=675281 RepID=UPI001EF31784|nr:DUF6492 family protein [Aquibium microcysteis]